MYFRICRARFEWLVNLEIQILPAQPAQADTLTQIAMAAKRHWGYPERWMELWKPQLTFSPSYFEENESRVAEIDHAPVAFYTLLEKDGSAWLENLWVSPEYMGGRGWKATLRSCDGTCSRTRLPEHATGSGPQLGRLL